MQNIHIPDDTCLGPMPDGAHVLDWGRQEIRAHLAGLGTHPGFLNQVVRNLIGARLFETFFIGRSTPSTLDDTTT